MPTRRHHKPYIPRADGSLRDWLNHFAASILADPGGYFPLPEVGAMLIELAQRYEAAYLQRITVGTRGSVQAKNEARRQAWRTVRPIAMQIKLDRRIPDGLKMQLGVYPPHDVADQSPIPAPTHAPLLNIAVIRPGLHRLRYQDASHAASRRKPPEAIAMELHIFITGGRSEALPIALPPGSTRGGRNRHHPLPSAPADGAGIGMGRERIQTATRHVFNVLFEPHDRGRTATYRGRWVTEKGLCGPWSCAVSMVIV